MRKLAHGLSCGKYSTSQLADKVITDQMTDEEKKKVEETDEYYQDGVRPQLFKTLVGKDHPEFKTGQQQDAREYLQYVLEKVVKAEKQAKASNPGKMFEFKMTKRLQCTKCNHVKYKESTERELIVQAPVASSVEKGTPVGLKDCLLAHFAEEKIDGLECAICNGKTTYSSTNRFVTFPKVLILVLQRFVHDDYVPKKLEVELTLPDGENYDAPIIFEEYKSATDGKVGPGEQGFPESADADEEVEPELDQAVLNMVLQMGLPENHAKHALHKCGANDADQAITWYFENQGDASLDQPLRVKKAGGKSSGKPEVPAEALMMMTSMGLSEQVSSRALRKCDMNVERAIDWAFSHMDEPDSDQEADGDSHMDL